jgi:hypothetical protein
MISVLASSAMDCGFEPRWDQTKDYTIGIICFDDVRFVLDQHAQLDFVSASSLKQQSAGRHVAPYGHIILIPRNKLFLSLTESWGQVKARHMFTITKPLVLSFSISLLFSLSGLNRIGGVMASVLASSMVYHGFTTRSGQTEDYKIGVW